MTKLRLFDVPNCLLQYQGIFYYDNIYVHVDIGLGRYGSDNKSETKFVVFGIDNCIHLFVMRPI